MSLEIQPDFIKFIANICEQTTNFFYKCFLELFFTEIMLQSFGCGVYTSLYGSFLEVKLRQSLKKTWAMINMIFAIKKQHNVNTICLQFKSNIRSRHHNINLLLTKHKGRTGEQYPSVVFVRTSLRSGRAKRAKRGLYKNDRGPTFPSTAQAS